MLEQRGDCTGAQRLEALPAHAARSGVGERAIGRASCLLGFAAPRRGQRSAARPGGGHEQLRLLGLLPGREESIDRFPPRRTELDLAQVEAQDGIGPLVALFVRRGDQSLHQRPRRLDLAAPPEPDRCQAVERPVEIDRGVRVCSKPALEIIDRPPTEDSSPPEGDERQSRSVGIGRVCSGHRLLSPTLRLGDGLDSTECGVFRLPPQHRTRELRLATGLHDGALEVIGELRGGGDCGAVGEEHERLHTHGTRGQRLDLAGQKVCHALQLSRREEVIGLFEKAIGTLGRFGGRQADRVARQLCSISVRSTPGSARCGGGYGSSKVGIRFGRRKCEMPRALCVVLADLRERSVELAPLLGLRHRPRRRPEQRMRRPEPVPVDPDCYEVDRLLERFVARDCERLGRAEAPRKLGGHEHLASGLRKCIDTRGEQLVEPGRKVELVDGATLRRARQLQGVQRVAARGVEDRSLLGAREPEPEPLEDQTAERSDAERLELHSQQPAGLECRFEL